MAPRGPKVEQNDFSFEIRQTDAFPGGIFECEVWRGGGFRKSRDAQARGGNQAILVIGPSNCYNAARREFIAIGDFDILSSWPQYNRSNLFGTLPRPAIRRIF